MSISRLAFLDILQFDGGEVYRGAVLLTQESTVPLEFYLTDPAAKSDSKSALRRCFRRVFEI